MARKQKIPALKRLFTTGTLKQMAVARYQGGITWAQNIFVNDSVGIQQGILLFDSLEAATEYQRRQGGLPLVVCEFPVKSIEKELLLRCEEYRNPNLEFRQWIYPTAIVWDRCWWHTVKEVAEEYVPAEPPTLASTVVLASSRPQTPDIQIVDSSGRPI